MSQTTDLDSVVPVVVRHESGGSCGQACCYRVAKNVDEAESEARGHQVRLSETGAQEEAHLASCLHQNLENTVKDEDEEKEFGIYMWGK